MWIGVWTGARFTEYELLLHAALEAFLEATLLAVRPRFDRHVTLALAPASNLLQPKLRQN